MTFDELMKAWRWKPIRHCPGRYILHGAGDDLRPQDILKEEIEADEFSVDAAKDRVLVIRLDDGGVISYRRDDGSFLHTLNTLEGFERKLRQLGIDSAVEHAVPASK